ncbi:hypothetical protein LEP1GSC125_2027 [Leptospira mayottensis 200901122]|uniref:Uncharacterized protein n=1 Tax=Leptospira mayottensis 200901122 TaxID=1193010 RepID=A0AA87MSI0_9LEPT|nr:hypothetical protein LEP1GSC125_2027 [Leptospira mayottensis 200901122]
MLKTEHLTKKQAYFNHSNAFNAHKIENKFHYIYFLNFMLNFYTKINSIFVEFLIFIGL